MVITAGSPGFGARLNKTIAGADAYPVGPDPPLVLPPTEPLITACRGWPAHVLEDAPTDFQSAFCKMFAGYLAGSLAHN